MTKIKPLVSVVIPTHNLVSDLVEAIDSIREQDYSPIEIIVVDNASTDGTSEKIKRSYPEVKLITHKENLGVTGGRNSGLNKAEGEYILFFDHDMVGDKKMVSELVKVASSSSEIGIVSGKIYYWDAKKAIWSAGTSVNLITGQIFFRAGQDEGQYDRIEEIQVAPAVLLVKREVIKKIGGFDDIFFANWEDTDFCFRARRAGFKIYYAPKAVAYHKITLNAVESMNRLLSRAYYIARNRIIFMRRHSKHFRLFLLFLPIYFFYYTVHSLRIGRIDGIKNFLRGTLSGLYMTFKDKNLLANSITIMCPLCKTIEEADIFLYEVKNPRNIGKEYYNYVKCRNCGLVYLDPMPTREELNEIYGRIYDHYQEDSNSFQERVANLLSKPREKYVDSVRKAPGRILDIGCGTGTFLQKMKERGWDTYGTELTEWAGRKAATRIGKDRIFIMELHKCHFPNNYFDVVTLWHVLEHVRNPNDLINEIKRILKKDGFIIIEVPNLASLTLRLFQHNYPLLYIPEHLLYWSKDSLGKFLQKNDFYIEKVSYPFMLLFTFSRSMSKYLSKFLKCSFIIRALFILSLPLSAIITFIACRFKVGETIRVSGRKL